MLWSLQLCPFHAASLLLQRAATGPAAFDGVAPLLCVLGETCSWGAGEGGGEGTGGLPGYTHAGEAPGLIRNGGPAARG